MTATTKKTAVPPPAGPPPPLFVRRSDVDALKALATLLVILSLAGVPGLGGGFVGYDVFFVVVGFLVVRRLYSEVMDERELDIVAFFKARFGRLFPTMAAVSVAALVVSIVVLSRWVLREVAAEALSSVVFLSNVVMARQAGGFFAADVRDSPLLVTWSVSTVGQFVVLAGLLFLLTMPLLEEGRSRAVVRPVLLFVSMVGFVVFGAVAGYLTYAYRSWAFFTLPGRLFEFLAGAVLAMLALPEPFRSRTARMAMTIVGLVVISGAAIVARNSALYPFPWGLVPVAGAVLVLAAGDERDGRSSPFTALLDHLPLQTVARFSYGWYLTFFPTIVLLDAALNNDGLPVRLAGLAGSLVLCAGATLLAGHTPWAGRVVQLSPKRAFLSAGAVVLVVALIAAGAALIGEPPDAYASVRGQIEAAEAGPTYECSSEATTSSGIKYCRSGQLDAPVSTVMLLGDGRVKTWKGAMAGTAFDATVQLVDRYLEGCPVTDMRVTRNDAQAEACAAFRRESLQLIRDIKPRAVFVAQRLDYGSNIVAPDGAPLGRAQRQDQWRDKTGEFFAAVAREGARPISIEEPPVVPTDPIACMRENKAVTPCAFSLTQGRQPIKDLQFAEASARKANGSVPLLSVTGQFCSTETETCAVVANDTLVYGSADELAPRFVAEQRGQISKLLARAGA
ncbi:MAG: acyltransferase [Actinobacteria bacterium]|nr:acyltransferase [Actinomycetota bacterium]